MSLEPTRELSHEPLVPEFISRLSEIKQAIDYTEQDARKPQFHYGPIYEIASSDGTVHCFTLFRERPAQSTWQYEVLTQQTDGRIVARAGGNIFWVPSHGFIASQDLMTGVRGKRLAAPTAAVFFDLVQRRADELDESITIREEDANGRWIKHLEGVLRGTEDTGLYNKVAAQLATARAERVHWLRLFGPGGTLGYDGNLEKIVRPRNHDSALKSLTAVTLAPRLEHGQPIVMNEITIPQAEVNFRQSELRQHVLRSLHQTIARTKKS